VWPGGTWKKGTNQAVGLSQLGVRVGLVAVVGQDPVGSALLRQARADRVQVSGVTRRNGADTGLVVDVVSADGCWHYLEDLPGDPAFDSCSKSWPWH
jgi:ribokinase